MVLDSTTPRGLDALAAEREAIALFERVNSGYCYAETPKSEPAEVDGVIYKDGVLVAAVECKVRSLTRQRLHDLGDEWLVTADKVERGRVLSKALGVPFVGFLFLLPERRLFTLRITDGRGNYIIKYDVRETMTRATINGGKAVRANAYLPMTTAIEQVPVPPLDHF